MKRKKSNGCLFIVFVFTLLAAVMGTGVYFYFFAPNNSMVPAFDERQLNLVVEGEIINSSQHPKIIDNEILIPFDTIKDHIDPYISWDERLKKVTVTTKDRVIRMKTDSLSAIVNNKPMTLNIPVTQGDGTLLVPIEFLSEFYNIKISYLNGNNVIIIDNKSKEVRNAELQTKKATIRRGNNKRFPIIKKLVAEDKTKMRIFGEDEKWYKVRTEDGAVGYIEKKFVSTKTIPSPPDTNNGENNVWKPVKGKINLVWEQTYSQRIDVSSMDKMDGVDIISPTWFVLDDAEGKILNRGDAKFTKWAHNKGYQVWALASNSFNDIDSTVKMLNNADARDNFIKQLLAYSSLYKLDGINIDFEGMNSECRDSFTQFIREATPLLKEQGLTVSVDINSAACYDRVALSKTVDYVMVMTYDQHWKGSTEAGSVAQLSWVESMLKQYLESIPKEKLLLGIPFYTRIWKTGEADNIVLDNKAVSMEEARNETIKYKASVKWDEDSGQFYAEYKKEGANYKIWLEDENSINMKSSLIHKYNVAGAASWSRNFAEPVIWEILNKNLKETNDYQKWKSINDGKTIVYQK